MKSDLYRFEVWLIEGATIIFTQMEAWIGLGGIICGLSYCDCNSASRVLCSWHFFTILLFGVTPIVS